MTSLETYAGDLTVNLVVPVLIILGGLGFLVIDELRQRLSPTQHKRLSTHTRTVLRISTVLVVGGAAADLHPGKHEPRCVRIAVSEGPCPDVLVPVGDGTDSRIRHCAPWRPCMPVR